MIEFKEGQSKIYLGKHKLTPSSHEGMINLHIVYPTDEKSGYSGKFVRIITVENKYSLDELRAITPVNSEEDILPQAKYFENGGYLYDKKTF